jgi:hypothetical protein
MPTFDEQDRRPSGTVYGVPRGPRSRLRLRLPRDRLMRVALSVGAVGVLTGALLAAGVFAGGGGRDSGILVAIRPGGATPGGTAAGTATKEPSPTAVPPSASATAPVGAKVFHSVASALCLDSAPGPSPEGAMIVQAACTGAPSQQWLAVPAGSAVTALVSAASGRCLDVDGSSRAEGAPLRQVSCGRQPSQQWRLRATGTGSVLLVNANSGLCLTVPTLTPAPTTPLHQSTCTPTPTRQWTTAQP